MGIRGLTTFINNNQETYFDSYSMPANTIIILDGESVAANIYSLNLKERNTFFGGEYEIYAEAVTAFFKMLLECKVIPYVVCSGATETRKVDTLMDRMAVRINKIMRLDGRNEVNEPIYPLFIGEVFRDVLKSMNVKMVVCDFEADLEVANIAKELDAPVISLDSDFYIFDVKYIPFSLQVEEKIPNIQVKYRTHGRKAEPFLTCKIFNRKTFLTKTGLTMDMLPILTLYLGNDFVKRVDDIPRFLRHLSISNSRNFVGNIISFLSCQEPENAVLKLVNFHDKGKQEILRTKIRETIKGYACGKSKYLKYFNSNETANEQDRDRDSEEYLKHFPQNFLDKYRRGCYQHNFMEILLNHRYYPKPLVENLNREHSYKKSYGIISAVHNILTNSSAEDFVVFARQGTGIRKEVVPAFNRELPSYEYIQTMDLQGRESLLFDILQIDTNFAVNCLNLFDNSWKILLITLKFLSTVSKVTLSFVYSLILCKVIISEIGKEIGQIRTREELHYKFPRPRVDYNYRIPNRTFQKFTDFANEIVIDDCALTLDAFLSFFNMRRELKYDSRLFDRNLLHLMSEFQACLLHINFLNALLNTPFEKCLVWKCFNGTFIYNLTDELNKKGVELVPYLLQQSPRILNCFQFAADNIKNNISVI